MVAARARRSRPMVRARLPSPEGPLRGPALHHAAEAAVDGAGVLGLPDPRGRPVPRAVVRRAQPGAALHHPSRALALAGARTAGAARARAAVRVPARGPLPDVAD